MWDNNFLVLGRRCDLLLGQKIYKETLGFENKCMSEIQSGFMAQRHMLFNFSCVHSQRMYGERGRFFFLKIEDTCGHGGGGVKPLADVRFEIFGAHT